MNNALVLNFPKNQNDETLYYDMIWGNKIYPNSVAQGWRSFLLLEIPSFILVAWGLEPQQKIFYN